MPANAQPHPENGPVLEGNNNVLQGWQHDLFGVGQNIHQDMGLNAKQMVDFQQELQPLDEVVMQNNWDAWPEVNQGENIF